MTKQEFLERLRLALENGLDSRAVQENMEYYRSYIEGELERGRSEEEVLDELGDPWVIAQSVIGMAGQGISGDKEYRKNDGYGDVRTDRSSENSSWGRMHTYRSGGWWRGILLILGLIGVIWIVFAVVGGLLSIAMPLILPVLIVVLLIRIFQKLR